jgi:hypothetical protein
MDQFKHTHQAVSAEVLTRMLGFAAPAWLAFGTRTTFDVVGRGGREADLG